MPVIRARIFGVGAELVIGTVDPDRTESRRKNWFKGEWKGLDDLEHVAGPVVDSAKHETILEVTVDGRVMVSEPLVGLLADQQVKDSFRFCRGRSLVYHHWEDFGATPGVVTAVETCSGLLFDSGDVVLSKPFDLSQLCLHVVRVEANDDNSEEWLSLQLLEGMHLGETDLENQGGDTVQGSQEVYFGTYMEFDPDERASHLERYEGEEQDSPWS